MLLRILTSCLAALGLSLPALAQSDAWTKEELERVTRRIEKQVEQLRGHEFLRPVKVFLADKKGFIDYALERSGEMQDEARTQALELVAKHLGLIPVDMDMMETTLALLEEQVGGFYDPGKEAFYLMESFTGGVAEVILAHELTHALDDQLHDLDGTLEQRTDSSDAIFAYSAVVEGSGTNAMQRWTLQNMDRLTMSDLTEASSMGTDGLADAPPYLWLPLLGTYMKGEAFLTRGRGIAKVEINAAIDRAFSSPPASTEQILHPEKYWDPAKLDSPSTLRHDLSGVPEGWKVMTTDTMGEIGLAMFATPAAKRQGFDASSPFALMALQYTNRAASGWDGDQLVLLGREDGARVLHLATSWDRERDADEFRDALEAQLEGLLAAQKQLGEGRGGWLVFDYADPRQLSFALYSGCEEADVMALREGPLSWSEERAQDSIDKSSEED